MDEASEDLAALTAGIIAAYVSHNAVRSGDLPELISATYATLHATKSPAPPEPEKLVPIVPIKKSVTADYLISLEDGKRYKSLKRHLSGRGLTPAQYRTKWGMPSDYPMVAPSYAKQRSDLARALGLGKLRHQPQEAEAKAPAPAPAPAKVRKPRATKTAPVEA